MDLIPGLGRSLGGGNGNPLWYFCLENPMERGAWLGYSPWGCRELDTTEYNTHARACARTHTHTHTLYRSGVFTFIGDELLASDAARFPNMVKRRAVNMSTVAVQGSQQFLAPEIG